MSSVYDMPFCEGCADDAMQTGVFDSKLIRGIRKDKTVIAF